MFLTASVLLGIASMAGCTLFSPNEAPYRDLAKSNLRCLALTAAKAQFIVRTDAEYKALFSSHSLYDVPACKDLDLTPPADLTQFTILGAYAQGTGCQAYQQHQVDRNDKKRYLSYFYELNTIGQCKKAIILPGWIAVKTIPADYEIKIRSEHRHTDRDK